MRIPGPRTWRVRLLVVGIFLVIVGRIVTIFPSARVPGEAVLNTGGLLVLLGALGVLLAKERKSLREKPGRPNLGTWIQLVAVAAAGILLFLTTQGNPGALGTSAAHLNRHGLLPTLESFALGIGLVYTLFYSPEVLHRELPFEQASDQALRLLPAGLAVGAAIVTGSYLFALHFFNEPLARFPLGPLAASIVAVMALLTPLYQLTARACWRYGLANLIDPAAWLTKWSELANEFTNYPQALPGTEEEQPANRKDTTDPPAVSRGDEEARVNSPD